MRSLSLAPWLVAFAALSSPLLLRAQQLTGSVEGTVEDASGGLVVGTNVDLAGTEGPRWAARQA